MNPITTNVVLVGVLGLLAVGLYALLICRNLIKLIIALQIMVKAALLGLVFAGSVNNQINVSQSMAITVIVVDTVVAVIGLALAVQIRRQQGTLDVRQLSNLKG